MLVRSTNLSQPSLWPWPDDWGQGARGVWAGNYNPEVTDSGIEYVTISTPSNSVMFGFMSCDNPDGEWWRMTGASGQGRGIIAGGCDDQTNNVLKIHYITIDTKSNSTSFGNLTVKRADASATSNGIRALIFGGNNSSNGSTNGNTNTTMDYITIATPGNATAFGTITSADNYSRVQDATGDGVYGMHFVGTSGGYSNDKYDYVAIDTPGNTIVFGTVTNAEGEGLSCNSNGSRAFWAGGYDGGSPVVIDYLTWSTPSNGTQYGNLRANSDWSKGLEDGSRAIIGGGNGFGDGTGDGHIEYYSMDLSAGSSVVSALFGLFSYAERRDHCAGFAG